MASYKSHDQLHSKRRLGIRKIIYIIAGVAVCIYMLLFFLREIRKEENYWKHINKEHGHAG